MYNHRDSFCSFCLDARGITSWQNEPKNQGCEVLDGGHGISATFDQWSAAFKACKLDNGRYDKRYPQIFQLPESAKYFKAGCFLRNKI